MANCGELTVYRFLSLCPGLELAIGFHFDISGLDNRNGYAVLHRHRLLPAKEKAGHTEGASMLG